MKYLFYLYIFTMPFVSAFAFSEHLNIPLILAASLLLYLPFDILIQQKTHELTFGAHIWAILIWLFIILVSYLYNSLGNPTTTNHLMAYFTVLFCHFIAIQYYLLKYRKEEKFYRRVLFLINALVVMSTTYGCVEFAFMISGHSIDKYIPRVVSTEYNMSAMEGEFLIKRIRGFAEESGHFSFMLEIFMPIQIYYLFYSGYSKIPFLLKIFFVLVGIVTILLTVSTATFICVPVALIATAILFWKKIWTHFYKFVFYINLFALFIIYLFYQFPLAKLIELAIKNKISNSGSMDDRSGRLTSFFDSFPHAPLINQLMGYGPSGYKIAGVKTSFISLYPTFIFESGIVGFLFYLFFHGFIFYQLLKIKNNINIFLTISFITSTLHYFLIGDYWYPWFWFLCAFIIYFKQKERCEEILVD